MTTTSQNGFKIDQPIPDIEGGSKSPRALNNPVGLVDIETKFGVSAFARLKNRGDSSSTGSARSKWPKLNSYLSNFSHF